MVLPVVISDWWQLAGFRIAAAVGALAGLCAAAFGPAWAALIPGGAAVGGYLLLSHLPTRRARIRAARMGLRAAFILGPPGFASRALGRRWFGNQGLFPDPVTPERLRRWMELHVDTRKRWGCLARDAIARYRVALERDLEFLCDWGAENDRTLSFSGFVRWPSGLLERLDREGRLVLVQGPLRPYQPQLWTRGRYEAVQERMFGGVWTGRDRTDPAKWWTVVVLPAPAERLGR